MSALTTAQATLLNKASGLFRKIGLGSKLVGMSHVVVAAGSQASVGGSANETITISGCLSTDVAVVTLKAKGATPRTILTCAAASGQINVVMSGDASTDHTLAYVLYRAV